MPKGSQPAVRLRPYRCGDRAACLAIFDGNTPDYFAATERADFVAFLDAADAVYLVVENATAIIVGCGGYYVNSSADAAGLTWGMIDRACHRQGLGRALLEARLSMLKKAVPLAAVRVNTSQRSRGFFERCGFQAQRVVANGFAPGIDRIELQLSLGSAAQGARRVT